VAILVEGGAIAFERTLTLRAGSEPSRDALGDARVHRAHFQHAGQHAGLPLRRGGRGAAGVRRHREKESIRTVRPSIPSFSGPTRTRGITSPAHNRVCDFVERRGELVLFGVVHVGIDGLAGGSGVFGFTKVPCSPVWPVPSSDSSPVPSMACGQDEASRLADSAASYICSNPTRP
jgi:hypothetical protein